MNRRGVILPLVLVGILATVALIPFLVTNTETITKNITAIDESNRIYWAAEGAACDAYKKSLKSNSTLEMDDLTIDKEGENIIDTDAPRFQYGSFIASTTVDARTTLHEERACWVASASAEGYDFDGKIKAVYVKPGVEYAGNPNLGAFAWDKNGILYKIVSSKLEKYNINNKINDPVWQVSRYLILDINGKAKYIANGEDFCDDAAVIASNYDKSQNSNNDKKSYRIDKNNKVLDSNGDNVKWKHLLNDSTGELENIVHLDGHFNHMFALKDDGKLYGWGKNDKFQIIRKLVIKDNKYKKVNDSFTATEAVLIKNLNAMSNSVVDLTSTIYDSLDGAAINLYLNKKYGNTPHYCKDHDTYNENCNKCNKIKEHPWTENDKTYQILFFTLTIGKNCICDLCKEIRDISLNIDKIMDKDKDPRSLHTDECHCSYCWDNILNTKRTCLVGFVNPLLCICEVCKAKRAHFWGCHCDTCNNSRLQFYNNNNLTTDKVPNPSTPLHLEEDTKIKDLQLLVDANSAFYYKDSFYKEKSNVYKSSIEFRAKFVPKNPPTTKNNGDVGTYKTGVTSDNLNKIYLIDCGYIKDKKNVHDYLPNVWLVRFENTTEPKIPIIKKGNEVIEKLPAGDYEVIFEYRLKIEDRLSGFWNYNKDSTTDWKTIEPYNMLWGVDKNGVTNNKNYFGCIFRLNEYLFNTTSGKLWEPYIVCAVATAQNFSVILVKNTDEAVINKGKYKILTWGNDEKNLGRENADKGMNEVIFKDENENIIDVAKNVRSLKAGQDQVLVLTDDGTKRELWTWGAEGTIKTPKKLNLDLDAPIVAIACGGSQNLLITENNTVYQWSKTVTTVNKSKIIPKKQ